MRLFTLLVSLFFGTVLFAQQDETKAVQKTIETFFEGFHSQDSILIKQVVSEGIVLQSIGKDPSGEVMVRTEAFGKFIKSIVSIPETTKFQEVLKSFEIQIDGPMANAWTPYEFRLNDAFHHCGVNSFQLVKHGEDWKIVYLIDTRRKTGCDEG